MLYTNIQKYSNIIQTKSYCFEDCWEEALKLRMKYILGCFKKKNNVTTLLFNKYLFALDIFELEGEKKKRTKTKALPYLGVVINFQGFSQPEIFACVVNFSAYMYFLSEKKNIYL